MPHVLDFEVLQREVSFDDQLVAVCNSIRQGMIDFPGYSLARDRLLFQGRVVLPRTSTLIPLLLQEFHGSAIGGHSSVFKTYRCFLASFIGQE